MLRPLEKEEIGIVNKSLLQYGQGVVNQQPVSDTANALKALGYLESGMFKAVGSPVRALPCFLIPPTQVLVPYNGSRESTDLYSTRQHKYRKRSTKLSVLFPRGHTQTPWSKASSRMRTTTTALYTGHPSWSPT